MRRLTALVFAVALSCGSALADDTPPWQADQQLSTAVMTEVQRSGILMVKAHLDELEHALAGTHDSIATAAAGTPTSVVLTDGPAQSLMGMLMAAGARDSRVTKSIAVPNPYPQIGLLLGSYYNEIGRPEDSVRVLDLAIASDKIHGIAGEMAPVLQGERANALGTLKRWPEVLAAYEEALAPDNLDPTVRAHLLRGRGYAYTELGRLDDAQKDYQDSLVLAPGNPTALNELEYLKRLRGGAAPTVPGTLKPLQPPTPSTGPTDSHG